MKRYSKNYSVIQPKREIDVASTDIYYQISPGDRLDNLADDYYGDKLASIVLMWANPQYYNEWEVKVGDVIRIPFPIERIKSVWNLED